MRKKITPFKLRIRKFEKSTLKIHQGANPMATTIIKTVNPDQRAAHGKPGPIIVKQQPKDIPLFTETLFKAKEYDPL